MSGLGGRLFRALVARAATLLRVRLTRENWRDLSEFGAFLADYKKRILAAGGTMLLTVLLQLPLPFLTMWVVNELVETRDIGIFPLVVTGLLVLVVSTAMVNLVHNLLVTLLREHALSTLEMRLVDHLHRLPLGFFYDRTSGYLATRIRSDLRNLNALLAGPLLNAVQSALLLVGAVAGMFVLSWRLAVVTFLCVPPFVLTLLLFNRRIRERSLEVQEWRAGYGSRLQETFSSMAVIKAFGDRPQSMRRLRHDLRELILAILKLEVTRSVARRLTYVLGMLAPVLVLWYGAYLHIHGGMSIGHFVGFHTFLGYIFGPIQSLMAQNFQVQSALVSLHRIFEFRRQAPEPSGSRPLPAGTGLCLEEVGFAYKPGQPVLSGVDLAVEPGETVGLVGSSGGGKTTLMRLLLRFHDPTEGRLLLGGVDVRELDVDAYRSRFGVAFQEPHLWSGTVAENLRMGRWNASEAELRAACEAAVAWDFVAELPAGLDTRLGEGGMTLSAGQKVRLAIARALLREAPVLLLDEPTAALDRDTAEALIDSLGHFLVDRTAIIISHQTPVLRLATRSFLLADGRCRELAPHEREEIPQDLEAAGELLSA